MDQESVIEIKRILDHPLRRTIFDYTRTLEGNKRRESRVALLEDMLYEDAISRLVLASDPSRRVERGMVEEVDRWGTTGTNSPLRAGSES